MSEDQKSAIELAREAAEAKAEEINKSRTGIGLRVFVGATRGKNPQIISFEQFDDSQPETLPKTIEEFSAACKFADGEEPNEKTVLDYLIRGKNAANYEAASDPLKEYVVQSWPADAQSTFRQAVRNYSRGLQVSLEDAANLIRPGFIKKFGDGETVAVAETVPATV